MSPAHTRTWPAFDTLPAENLSGLLAPFLPYKDLSHISLEKDEGISVTLTE